MSAPPTSVTVLQEPNAPQVPPVSVAEARSTTALERSSPDSESLPSTSVSPTDSLAYHGPVARATDWPAGAVESAEIVIESLAVAPAVIAAVTVRAPGPEALGDQLYVVDPYGLDVALPPAPFQPATPERSGKVTWSTPDCGSAAVAFSVNEPETDGRNQSVPPA